ncbi:MAG: universal stress protein [Pseudomonadota bacterium]
MMKSILLHINNDAGMEARMQAALDLARAYDAHITCLQAISYEIFAPGDFYGSAMAAAMPKIREAAEEHRAKIEGDLANEDVSWEWILLHGMPETRLLELSALQDLIVVGPNDVGEQRGPSRLVGELVMKAPCPVLVVPEDTKSFDVTAPILVAWNGSSEACTALRNALPLLGKASTVFLASVGEEKDDERFDFPPVEGAKYLSRYGIDAEMVEIPAGDAKIADVLSSAAQTRDCGLMVMGAYGHSRLSEMLLGGVTRRAITDPDLPILLAH